MTTRRRNSYLSIIAIGGVALLVDRLLLTDSVMTPSIATAGVQLPPTHGDPAASSELPAADLVPNIPFPRALPRYQAGDSVDHLFLPPHLRNDPRFATGDQDSAGSNGHNGDAIRFNVHQFQANYQLTGVILNKRVKLAIVNGQWVRIGQSLSGCSLSNVNGTEAHFTCTDGVAVLRLADANAKPPN